LFSRRACTIAPTVIMLTTEATIIREALLSDPVQITSLISELAEKSKSRFKAKRIGTIYPPVG